MPWGLQQAVGLTNVGGQAANISADQQQVAELLDAVFRLPVEIPGIPHEGTNLDTLPAIEDGQASGELVDAIRRFQQGEGDLIADGRVDVDGATWQRLLSLVNPGNEPPGPVPLMLSFLDVQVVELPTTASGPPALTYTIRGEPVAVFAGPGVTIELSVVGPVSVSWEGAYPVACTLSPDFAALEAAVASGAARAIGASALSNLCSQIQLESKAAVGGLFASVSLSFGLDGSPTLGGSIGNGYSGTSVSFDPVQRAIIYAGDIAVLKPAPVTGGEAKLSGKLRAEIKVKAEQDSFEASVAAALAVVLATGGVFLVPVIEGLGIESSVAVASNGVRAIVARLFAAISF